MAGRQGRSVNSDLGLYLHIPFCQAICSYCNFNRGLLDEALKARYVGALDQEIRLGGGGRSPETSGQARHVDTVFFGGGTPSLLDPEEVERLITACRESFSVSEGAEVTLEANPETLTVERLRAIRRAGVTRLSVGVQSFDDAELARLGRIHSASRARDAIAAAARVGFESVSLDLMFWLPGQSLASWRATIDQALQLPVDHLSLYLLELYPSAPLKEALARGGAPQVSDDLAADMYLEALERLDLAGFEQYEISNVARPGHASRHNVKYWQGGQWRGFGCGAHSTVDGVRWRNVSATSEYVDRMRAGEPVGIDRRALAPGERLEEALFTGLRLTAGVSRRDVGLRHGVDPWLRYGERLAPFIDDGLMWQTADADRFGLTRRGMLVANELLSTFV
jgi:oxygen-independent coproporphyrinogen-3 oxidase